MMRWLIALLLALSTWPALATADGLMLGFLFDGEQVQRISIATLSHSQDPERIAGERWSVVAESRTGSVLWQLALPAPRRFDAGPDPEIEFAIRIPRVSAGTRLGLRDAHGRERWSERIERAHLAQADARGARAKAESSRLRATTARLSRAPDGSPLHAQMKHAWAVASRTGDTPVAGDGPDDPHSASVSRRPAGTARTIAADARIAAIAALDATRFEPHRAVARATQKGTSAIQISVVDEQGDAPGAAFDGTLLRDGDVVQQVTVDALGQATLMLEPGATYELQLAPPPPLLQTSFEFAYTGAPPAAFVLERGWILDVELRDGTGAPITTPVSARVTDIGSDVPRRYLPIPNATPGLLRFALPRSADAFMSLVVRPSSAAYPDFSFHIGALSGDRTIALTVATATIVPGVIRAADGGPLTPGATVACSSTASSDQPSYFSSPQIASDGSFALRVPTDRVVVCYAYADDPMLTLFVERRFSPGDSIDLPLLRGAPVRFVLRDQHGAAPTGTITGHAFTSGAIAISCVATPCELTLPTDRTVEIDFTFGNTRYLPVTLAPAQYAPNSEHLVVVQRTSRVAGRVRDGAIAAPLGTRVRVFDADGDFVVSSRGEEFEFLLPDGSYRIEADPNSTSLYPIEWTFLAPASATLTVQGDTTVPDLILPTQRGEVVIDVERPCGLVDRGVRLVLDGPDAPSRRRVDGLATQDGADPAPPQPPGQCASRHRLSLAPGDYALDVAPFGWPLQRVDLTVVDGAEPQRLTLAFVAEQRTEVWRGTLRDAQQHPIVNAILSLHSDNEGSALTVFTDAQGRFELPFVPGWSVRAQVFGYPPGRPLDRALRFGDAPPPPDFVLEPIDLDLVPDRGLQRMFGDGDLERRLNIVFVAEGYTDAHETFTDLNGNGVWDGVVWYDYDGSGVFEYARDRIALRGNIAYPAEGSVPTAQNEPFVDLNGDTLLSVDDAGLFVANAEAFLRSLLSWDFFREHRDAFNAYLLFTPSAQAGHDVRAVDGSFPILRDTRYDGVYSRVDATTNLNRTAVLEDALAALPQVDLVVVLMHEPIVGGRANASAGRPGVIVQLGGLHKLSGSDSAPAHEMGHHVAYLCDEYALESAVHPSAYRTPRPPSYCANATFEVDPARIPWRALLPQPMPPLPTRDLDGGLGLFEGAGTFQGGMYRPSFDSTMRGNSPFFNLPSRLALAPALDALTIGKMVIFGSGFEAETAEP